MLLTELNHLEHEVKWFKDGEEISPKSNHYTIFSEGTMRKLRIGSSKEEDTATYSVCHIDDLTNKVIIFIKYSRTLEVESFITYHDDKLSSIKNVRVESGPNAKS